MRPGITDADAGVNISCVADIELKETLVGIQVRGYSPLSNLIADAALRGRKPIPQPQEKLSSPIGLCLR